MTISDTGPSNGLFSFVFGIAKLCRTSAYAAYQPRGKQKYRRIEAEITSDVINAHLDGSCPIACYGVMGEMTQSAVLDLDDHDKSLEWSEMVKFALPLVQRLESQGFNPLCVRSGGGAGLHIWLIWENPQKARLVRAFLSDVLAHCGCKNGTGGIGDNQVEVFPKNDAVKEGKYGNAVALPFSRASVPLDDHLQPIELTDHNPPPFAELFSPQVPQPLNKPAVLSATSANQNTSPSLDDESIVDAALRHVTADDHDTWIKVGLALKLSYGEGGFPMWLTWSKTSAKYVDEDDCRERWATLDPDGSVTLGTVFHLAKENGWNRPVEPVIHDMNAKYAIFTHGQKTMIVVKQPDDDGTSVVTLLGKTPFEDRLAAKKHAVSKGDDGTKVVRLSSYWLGHKDADHVHRLDFDPGKLPGKNGKTWNVWTGFAVKPEPGNWDRLEGHIRDNIASGDPELSDWMLNWMALGVQNPDSVIGTAPVMLGLPGVGKGVLAHAYGSLWGRHFATITHSAHVKGRFNNHLFGKRCVFIDEGIFSGDRTDSGVIKTRLTEPYVILEQKGIDPIQVRNHMIFMVASNEDAAVPADLGDRRWQVLEVADNNRDDKPYFRRIIDQLNNGGREAFLHDLLARDISNGPDPRRTIKTAGLFEQTIRAGGPDLRYMFEILDEGVLPQIHAPGNGPGVTTIGALYEEMCNRDQRGKYTPVTSFGKKLKRMCPSLKTVQSGWHIVREPDGPRQTRSTRYEFPGLASARQEFERFAGQAVPWTNERVNWQAGQHDSEAMELEPPF